MSIIGGYYHKYSIRLRGADYSVPGFYFVTVCTKNREHLFGEVVDGEMRLNEFGKIVDEEIKQTPKLRKNVIIDACVVMPNHVHLIILITECLASNVVGIDCINPDHHGNLIAGIDCINPDRHTPGEPIHQYGPQSNNLFAIVRGFKGAVTKKYYELQSVDVGGSVWQSRFHDHIIRDSRSLERIRQYIRDNPFNWRTDLENNKFKIFLTGKEREKYIWTHYNQLFA